MIRTTRLPGTRLGTRLAMLLALTTFVEAGSTDITRLIVFGDSLSDTGNVDDLTFGVIPEAPYFDGRFSDGPVWVERLAASLQVPAPTPSRNGGTNYAHGGAETGPGFSQFIIPNLGPQITSYINGGPAATPGDLFVVFAGGNDFFNGETNEMAVVNNLVDHITDLATAGGQQFLVANLPPLGQTPGSLGTPDEGPLDQATSDFNDLYTLALDELEAGLAITLYRFDTWGLFQDLLSQPGDFGLTNVTEPAYDEGSGAIVPNPEDYLFWDDIHPTATGHGIFGAAVYDMISSVPGDANGDGVVDVQDLLAVILEWGTCPASADCDADLNDDGVVDVLDLLLVILNWS